MSGYVNAFDVFDLNLRDRRQQDGGRPNVSAVTEEAPSLERNVFTASSRNQLGRLKAVLNSNPNIDLTHCVNGINALHSAAKKGYVDICRTLLDYYSTPDQQDAFQNARTDDGERKTALMIAAFNGQLAVVELLTCLQYTTDTESVKSAATARDERGNTAIHYAAWGGQLACVQYLVQSCYASVSVNNDEGLSPLQLAAAGNFHEVVEFLASVSSDCDASSRTEDSLGNNVSSSGMTALHRAASHGALETIRFFLEHQLRNPQDINIQAFNGNTALHYAAQHGHEEIVKQLTAHPHISLSIQSEYGLTPFHYACISGRPGIVAHLLPRLSRQEVVCLNSQGENALHLAAAAGEHEICRLLLEDPRQLFDVFVSDAKHASAIDKAVESGFKELANKLVLASCIQWKTNEIISPCVDNA
jgi:ankyrin